MAKPKSICVDCGKTTYGRRLCRDCYNVRLSASGVNTTSRICARCLEHKPISQFKSLSSSRASDVLCILCLDCRKNQREGNRKHFAMRFKPVTFPLDLFSFNCPFDGFDFQVSEKQYQDFYFDYTSQRS